MRPGRRGAEQAAESAGEAGAGDPGERWWGWQGSGAPAGLDSRGSEMLLGELGPTEDWPHPLEPGDVELPDAIELPPEVAALAGPGELDRSHGTRLTHALGKGYADLARLRGGRLELAPDAVWRPASAERLGELLAACSAHGVAVVPFGGGTSVVGGLEPLRGGHPHLISLDLAALRSVRVDRASLTAQLGAGLRGPEAEAELARAGLTLGHFPQSFERASIGGFAATRSAGQASTGYGRFDELVTSVRMVAPAGILDLHRTPHSAAGPSLRELVLGSEGTLGVITDVTVRVRQAPRQRRYEAWICPDFATGSGLVRGLVQGTAAPDLVRLSDTEETRVSLAQSGPRGLAGAALFRYLRLRGVAGGCLLVLGFEGEPDDVSRRRAMVASAARAAGCAYLGQRAGRAWERHRFEGPYLRDDLIDRGAMVETLETACEWSGIERLHRTVGEAIAAELEGQGTPGPVLCHLSHAYPDGASLYYTFICRARREDPLAQWRAVKGAASDAISAAGGTITHHHAVGTDHAPWMAREVGETGVETLRAVKQRLDPAGILNPGKLLPTDVTR